MKSMSVLKMRDIDDAARSGIIATFSRTVAGSDGGVVQTIVVSDT